MAGVDPGLAQKLRASLNLSQRQVNRLIDAIVREQHLTRQQAAIVLASRRRVNFSRFATEEDLAAIRSAGAFTPPAPTASAAAPAPVFARASRKKPTTKARRVTKERSTSVFVVHGRDAVRDDLFNLLRLLGLDPIEWIVGKRYTKKASPHNADVVEAILDRAAGAVVLFTPEEEVSLKPQYLRSGDSREEKKGDQSRPNVLFEAGMAYAVFRTATVFVRVGNTRQFTDLAGVQIINLTDGNHTGRKQLASALEIAGFPVNDKGEDWLRQGKFELAKSKKPKRKKPGTRKARGAAGSPRLDYLRA